MSRFRASLPLRPLGPKTATYGCLRRFPLYFHRMRIRTETPHDIDQIRSTHLASFPDAGEAALVDALRTEGDMVFSLVAADGDAVVGHCLFSRMTSPQNTLGLGPVAVLPGYRRQGIADDLIRAGIDQARAENWAAIFVLGHPAYYQRFGFSLQMAAGFRSPYSGPYFMILPLGAADLEAMSRSVSYPPAFAALG